MFRLGRLNAVLHCAVLCTQGFLIQRSPNIPLLRLSTQHLCGRRQDVVRAHARSIVVVGLLAGDARRHTLAHRGDPPWQPSSTVQGFVSADVLLGVACFTCEFSGAICLGGLPYLDSYLCLFCKGRCLIEYLYALVYSCVILWKLCLWNNSVVSTRPTLGLSPLYNQSAVSRLCYQHDVVDARLLSISNFRSTRNSSVQHSSHPLYSINSVSTDDTSRLSRRVYSSHLVFLCVTLNVTCWSLNSSATAILL